VKDTRCIVFVGREIAKKLLHASMFLLNTLAAIVFLKGLTESSWSDNCCHSRCLWSEQVLRRTWRQGLLKHGDCWIPARRELLLYKGQEVLNFCASTHFINRYQHKHGKVSQHANNAITATYDPGRMLFQLPPTCWNVIHTINCSPLSNLEPLDRHLKHCTVCVICMFFFPFS
jgi:hypothetical protein